jgi:Flp pilus assembly pilin Flp
MDTITKMYVTVRNLQLRKLRRGQTMTEYALILAAIAVVVFITYEVMGPAAKTSEVHVNL